MNNKKILILVNHDIVIYNFRKELVEKLIKEKYDVYISSPYGHQIDKLINIGAKFIETSVDRRGRNPYKDLKLLLKYMKIIKNIKPYVVLTYTIKPNIYGGLAASFNKTPYLSNITGLGTAVEKKSIIQKITILMYKKSLKRAKMVYFQNEENMNFMIDKKIVKKDILLLPGSGVNLKYFKPLEYPSDVDGLHFLFIGRLIKEKGIDLYLEAAKNIKEKYPNTIFHVLGFGEISYVKKMEACHNNGLIIYHGRQDDVREFHKISHCLIHPSYYPEGMSNVLLESAACARPLITTDRSGCREVVYKNRNGLITRVNNLEDLIDKIQLFIQMPYTQKKAMGIEGRKYVENKFDRNIIVETYMKMIKKIIEV